MGYRSIDAKGSQSISNFAPNFDGTIEIPSGRYSQHHVIIGSRVRRFRDADGAKEERKVGHAVPYLDLCRRNELADSRSRLLECGQHSSPDLLTQCSAVYLHLPVKVSNYEISRLRPYFFPAAFYQANREQQL